MNNGGLFHSMLMKVGNKQVSKTILRHGGTWKGDDFQECLQTMYNNRQFNY